MACCGWMLAVSPSFANRGISAGFSIWRARWNRGRVCSPPREHDGVRLIADGMARDGEPMACRPVEIRLDLVGRVTERAVKSGNISEYGIEQNAERVFSEPSEIIFIAPTWPSPSLPGSSTPVFQPASIASSSRSGYTPASTRNPRMPWVNEPSQSMPVQAESLASRGRGDAAENRRVHVSTFSAIS